MINRTPKPCEPLELGLRVSQCFEKYELALKIKSYENILPVCCACKKIRDDSGKEPGTGKWIELENYIREKGGNTNIPPLVRNVSEKLRRKWTGHGEKAGTCRPLNPIHMNHFHISVQDICVLLISTCPYADHELEPCLPVLPKSLHGKRLLRRIAISRFHPPNS